MAQMADVAARICGKRKNPIISMESSEKPLSQNDVKKIVKEIFFH